FFLVPEHQDGFDPSAFLESRKTGVTQPVVRIVEPVSASVLQGLVTLRFAYGAEDEMGDARVQLVPVEADTPLPSKAMTLHESAVMPLELELDTLGLEDGAY